ncbi:MAG: MFS transporter [Alphaproteobacteria bacterium]|nr:MAG: MFS transporter [Alphaproteobacteria bacterium]
MEDKPQTQPTPYPPTGAGWYAVSILLVAYIFSFVDRQILSLLVEPIQQDLGVNDTQMGVLHGLTFALFYSVLGLPIARFVDRSNRRNAIAIGIALWSIATAFSGLSVRYIQLFLARIGVAVGEATLLPGTSSIVADYFEPKRRALAMGVFASGLYIGAGLAFIGGGLLIRAFEGVKVTLPIVGEAATWHLVFIAIGLPGLLVALLTLTMKEPPRREHHGPKGVPLSEVSAYFKDNKRAYIWFILGAGLAVYVGQATGFWVLTFFVRNFGWTYSEIGIRIGLIILVFGPIGTIAGGWIADRWVARGLIDGKVRIGLAASTLLVIPAVVFPLLPDPNDALIVYSFTVLIASAIWGAAPAAIQDMTPGPMRGQMTALYTGLINLIGLGLGPPSIGLLNDFVFKDPSEMKYSLILVGTLGTAAAATFFWLALKPYRRAVENAQNWRPGSST